MNIPGNYEKIAAGIFALAIILIILGTTGDKKTADNIIEAGTGNEITGQASAMDAQPAKTGPLCEFCRQTNDTVYKNSGACKPCFA